MTKEEFHTKADAYIIDTGDKKTSVATREEAIQGAKDILAEEVSDNATLRDDIRAYEENHALLTIKPTKSFEENGVYKMYKTYSKTIADMPSYAYLAIARAEHEKQLSVSMDFSLPRIIDSAIRLFVPEQHQEIHTVVSYVIEAIEDGLARLLLPSIEREIRSNKKHRADEAATKVFGDNMKHLLLSAPMKDMTVL